MIRNFRQIRAGTRSLSLVSQGENAYLCAHRPHPAVGYKDAAAIERRFFVMRGRSFDADGGAIPDVVALAAERVASPFFSVDVAERRDRSVRIIEIGDGQVSDRKHWSVHRRAGKLRSSAAQHAG